jgi:capsular polysaccharide biosynthesis protein
MRRASDLRSLVGVLAKDLPRYVRALAARGDNYLALCNREERLEASSGARGYRCAWQWTSDLHAPKYLPILGASLMRRALHEHPIRTVAAPAPVDAPTLSFVIGHRGLERLPHLLATLGSIAGQLEAKAECVVVEQDVEPRLAGRLPGWVRYIHTPSPPDLAYCRSWAFNVGVRQARGDVLVLHDNDMLVPADYARHVLDLVAQGFEIINLKRFIFYLGQPHTQALFDGRAGLLARAPLAVTQNLEGGGPPMTPSEVSMRPSSVGAAKMSNFGNVPVRVAFGPTRSCRWCICGMRLSRTKGFAKTKPSISTIRVRELPSNKESPPWWPPLQARYPDRKSSVRASNLLNFLHPGAPKGLIRSASEWVRQRNQSQPQMRRPQTSAWEKEIFPFEDRFNPLQFPLAPTPGEEFSRVRWTTTPAASLFYLQGCRVLGEGGAVISPDNRVFAEFTLPPADRWLDHSCFRRRRMPRVDPLKGWYATITWPESRFFFHWMIEALPRMAVLGEFAGILDGLFVPGPLQKFHREALGHLGFDETRLIAVDVESHFAPEHLFVPQAFAMYNPPRWLPAWFKRTYLQPAAGLQPQAANGKRIYISRADAPVRRVANEAQVMHMLARYGFESVRLSEHPFEAQARMFNQAEIVVGPNGAGLSHIVFCREGATIIEALPPRWMAPCFMALAAAAGCLYRPLLARETSPRGLANPQRDDIEIPVGELEAQVRAALE